MPNRKWTVEDDYDFEGEIVLIKNDRVKTIYRLRHILQTKMQQLETMLGLLRNVGETLDKWEKDEKVLLKKKDCWFLMQTLMHFSMSKEQLELLKKEWKKRIGV